MKNNTILRRLLCFVLLISLTFSMMGVVSVAAAGTTTIVFGEGMGKAGGSVTLPVEIQNNPGIATFRFRITYDTEALTFVSARAGDLLSQGTFTSLLDEKNHTVTFMWFHTENLYGDGDIAYLDFTFSQTATGDYPIRVTYLPEDLLNENYRAVAYTVEAGEVYVGRAVSGVTLNRDALYLTEDDTASVLATVLPDRAYEKGVIWKSDNEGIATVHNGVVTAVKYGVTTITATTVDGGYVAACVVNVACTHKVKTAVDAKAATCQDGGWQAYAVCDGCGQLLAADGVTLIDAVPTTVKNPHNHTNVQTFAADAATCVHQGHDAYDKCADCGVITSGSDATYYGAHSYGTLIPAVAETHTAAVLAPAVAAHYQCSLCQKYFTAEKVETSWDALVADAPSHQYGEWIAIDANRHQSVCLCGKKGEEKAHVYDNTCDTTCNDCGFVRTINHTWSTEWSTDGVTHWKACTVCHDAKNEEAAHVGGMATCATKAVCSVCKVEYGTTDATNHVGGTYVVEQKEPTCTAVGYTGDTKCNSCHAVVKYGDTLPPLVEIPSSTWSGDATHHWKECLVEGCNNTIDKAAHVGGMATCTSKAVCTVCKMEYGTTDATNHVGGTYVVEQKEPTCTAVGYTGDTKCNSCHAVVKYGDTLPPLVEIPSSTWSGDATHHWKECLVEGCNNTIDKAAHVGGMATCTSKAVCTVCKMEYGTVNATNHVGETEIRDAKPAENGKPGYTGDTWCVACNVKIKDGEVIPAQGVLGDVNDDGKVDSTDARMTLQYAVKKISADKLNLAVADVNGDGKVDSTDARVILQFAVKKINKFPVG